MWLATFQRIVIFLELLDAEDEINTTL